MPFIGYVRAKVVNLTNPNIDVHYTGPKTRKAPRFVDPNRSFIVRHLTPEESARERRLQREKQTASGVSRKQEKR